MIIDRIKQLIRSGDIALIIVVTAGFVIYYTSGVSQVAQVGLIPVTTMGLVYLVSGIWGGHTLASLKSWQRDVYFLYMLTLGGLICYFTWGAAWLILLPLVSEGFQHLSVPRAVILSAAVWFLEILPPLVLGNLSNFISAAMGYLSAIVFVAVFTQILVNEQKTKAELSRANTRLREYASKVEENAILLERNRLAREIHDGLGHYLTAINIQLKAAQAVNKDNPHAASEAVSKAQHLAEEALLDVRRSVSSLRSDEPAGEKVSDVLRKLLDEACCAGLTVDLEIQGEEYVLPPQTVFTFFRTAQEALTNVKKHAKANQATLKLIFGEHVTSLIVSDNGQGAKNLSGGYGLIGLRERVQLMGGSLELTSTPGQGFMVTVDMPYHLNKGN